MIGHARAGATQTVTVGSTPTTTPAAGGGSAAAGAKVFAAIGCGSCHTLATAGASGTVGPVLDGLPLTTTLVVDRVTHGKGGMPPFAARLSKQQIDDVAAYVVASAKR